MGGERHVGRNAGRQRVLAILGALAVGACAALTSQQVRYWQDSETLFTHAVESTKGNYLMCDNLGITGGQRAVCEGGNLVRRALDMKPDYAAAHNNYGIALAKSGRLDEAIAQFHLAIAIQTNYAHPHLGLGNALAAQGQIG